MTGDELRKSILAAAVRGALCPQDETDEPASALLARIREEKKKLIQEGKRKKEKNPTEIIRGTDGRFYERGNGKETDITDDLPFDIPDSWEWVRLGDIFSVINGDRGKNYPAKSTLSKDPIGPPFISAVNLENGTVVKDEDLLYLSETQYNRLRSGKLQKGDVVVCIRGSLGKHGRYPFDSGAIASSLVILRTFAECGSDSLYDYVMTWLDSPMLRAEIKKYDNGTAQPNLAAKNLEQFWVPVPPLAEQKRIIERLENLRPLIDEYTRIETEETARRKALPDDIKKSVLAHAVRGALCPQDETDEPAAALLARIRDEKKKLIQEGKRKKEKNPTEIHRGKDGRFYETENGNQTDITDDLPFDIPDSWEWVRLGEISTYAETKQKVKAKDLDPSIWSLDLEDIEKGGKIIARKTLGERKATGDKAVFKRGDILYSKLRPYLLKVLIAPDDGICSPEMIPFHLYGGIIAEYIVYYLKSPKVDLFVNSHTYGMKMPRVGTETMADLWVPLPPLAEQKRIAARLTQILSALENLR